MDFRKAYVLLKENRTLFPDFTPNELYFGLINTVIGTIPKGYMWLVNLFGMTGSISEGNAMVLKYINEKTTVSTYFKGDALFMYPYLVMNFEGNEKKAFEFLAQAPYDFRKNHLHAYMAANLHLTHQSSGRALDIVNQLDQSPEYLTIPFWHYEKGYAFLNQLNYAGAQQEFALFVRSFRGKFYVKDAYEKLSWVAYLQGDMKAASFYQNEVVRKGSLITEADKLASENALLGIWPNDLLLRARLLSDGGYQREAIRVLSGKTSNDFNSQTDRTEFVYRLARVYDLLEEDELAARYYQSAIDKGRNLPAYFASRAALQLGLLSEKKGDYSKAVGYYTECLDMDDHAFKNAMDQKALSGIQRCKKRG
jgi:tetratricopeptide (TPR) repeat protein